MVTSVEGKFGFYMGFSVRWADMEQWTPERITQFFNGIATAVAATKGMTLEEMLQKRKPVQVPSATSGTAEVKP